MTEGGREVTSLPTPRFHKLDKSDIFWYTCSMQVKTRPDLCYTE
jgi:hypothetical protein